MVMWNISRSLTLTGTVEKVSMPHETTALWFVPSISLPHSSRDIRFPFISQWRTCIDEIYDRQLTNAERRARHNEQDSGHPAATGNSTCKMGIWRQSWRGVA